MSNSTRNKHYVKNLQVETLSFGTDAPGPVSSGRVTDGMSVSKTTGIIPVLEEVRFTDKVFTLTDTGVGGAWTSLEILTLPATRVAFLSAFLSTIVIASSAGIVQDGVIRRSLGTTATADSTLATTDANILVAGNIVLTDGAGDAESALSTAMVAVDAAAGGVKVYLNIALSDADLTATGTVTMNGILRLIYIDVSGGA